MRLPRDGANGLLVEVLDGSAPATDIAAVAVFVEGRAAALLIANEFGDALQTSQRLQETARAAGQSLERLLRQRRK